MSLAHEGHDWRTKLCYNNSSSSRSVDMQATQKGCNWNAGQLEWVTATGTWTTCAIKCHACNISSSLQKCQQDIPNCGECRATSNVHGKNVSSERIGTKLTDFIICALGRFRHSILRIVVGSLCEGYKTGDPWDYWTKISQKWHHLLDCWPQHPLAAGLDVI